VALRATWLALLALLICAVPADAAPYGFSSAPTEQLAEPGWPVSVEVLPDGGVRTGFWELRFRAGAKPLKIGARTWANGYLPVLSGRGCSRSTCVKATYVYEQVAGVPTLIVRLRITGRARDFSAQVASTFASASASGVFSQAEHNRYPAPIADSRTDGLYKQPGQAFSANAAMTTAAQSLRRDGRTLLVASTGDVKAHAVTRADSVAGEVTVGKATTLTLALPIAPPVASAGFEARLKSVSASSAISSVKARWRALLAPAKARIKIPERKASDAVFSGLVTLLQSRMPAADGSGAWVQQVNALQYRAFWLRDNAFLSAALGRAGLETEARQDVAFIKNWQTADGEIISRSGQRDGTGQGLWALGEYARDTHDAAWAAQQLTTVQRAVNWIAGVRAADPLGLLPKGDPHDNEFTAGHLTGDNAWALSGLRAAADLATIAGDAALATQATAQAGQLEAALRSAATAAAKRTADHAVPSSLDPGVQSGTINGGSEGFDWGNYLLQWPEALPAGDPLVTATIKRAKKRSAEGLPLWHKNLHTYVGFGIRMAQLRQGDQSGTVAGYYAMLTHTNSTNGTFETGVAPFKGRSTQNNIAPHGTFAADLTLLTIAMLVDDRPDAVHLGSAVPAEWVRKGKTTRIGPIATRHGAVTLKIKATSKGAKLTWTAPAGARLVLHRPPWAKGAATIAKTGSGSATWSWKKKLPKTSFKTEARALQAAYRKKHKTPPSGKP
jgi:hypothetical protein